MKTATQTGLTQTQQTKTYRAFARFTFVASMIAIFGWASSAHAKAASTKRTQRGSASEFALPVPEKYGTFAHPVIFAATSVRFKEIATTSTQTDSYFDVRQNIVVQWGTSVFEIVRLKYFCDLSKTSCELDDGERLATYKSCEVKQAKVACKGLISAAADSSEDGRVPEYEETYETENTSHGEDFPDRIAPDDLSGLAP